MRTTNGYPIVLRSERAGALDVQVLAVPRKRQEHSLWCWAACCQMVMHYYGDVSVQQCEMADYVSVLSVCCSSPLPSGCNVALWTTHPAEKDIPDVFRRWGAFVLPPVRTNLLRQTPRRD